MQFADRQEEELRAMVVDAVLSSPENRLPGHPGEAAWGMPIVGFAAGDDPLFRFLKEEIGEFYWTPEEIFNLAFTGEAQSGADESRRAHREGVSSPGSKAVHTPANELSVISWVIPQTEATLADQRLAHRLPAERWILSRGYWPEMTRSVHGTVVAALAAVGLRSVAPEMNPRFSEETSLTYGFASRWSQRHTAYVAGLGTFGLSEGLITSAGVAMRAGSVVMEAKLSPTPRRYGNHTAWCPFLVDAACGECMKRCPAGAITKNGHDKVKCEAYIRTVVAPRADSSIGEREPGCGLCQAGVPCESSVPPSIGV